jgi:hypothetical protein
MFDFHVDDPADDQAALAAAVMDDHDNAPITDEDTLD